MGSNFTSDNGAVSPNGVPVGKSLMPVQDIDTNLRVKLKTMFDNCSQTTLMFEETAKIYNFRGSPVKYTLICTGGREEPMFGRKCKMSNTEWFHFLSCEDFCSIQLWMEYLWVLVDVNLSSGKLWCNCHFYRQENLPAEDGGLGKYNPGPGTEVISKGHL